MTLLDRNPHTVTVTPMVQVSDSMGTTIQPGDPVTLRVAVQPLNTQESSDLGFQAQTSCRVIGKEGWPGGVSSTVHIDSGPYEGRTFDQEGEPRWYGMTDRTRHYDVIITARGTEVP